MSNVVSCTWSMSFRGTTLGIEHRKCIESIDYEDFLGGSTLLTIKLRDPDLQFIEDTILVEEAAITFSMNMTGTNTTVSFEGYVATIDFDFGEEGVEINVSCLDQTHLMNREEKSKTWKKKKSTEVGKSIAAAYGYSFEAQEGYKFDTQSTISQSNQTDIVFLEDLASKENEMFYCKFRNGTIYYKQYVVADTPKLTMGYKQAPYSVKTYKPQITKETVKRVKGADITTGTYETLNSVLVANWINGNPAGGAFGSDSTLISTEYGFDFNNGGWVLNPMYGAVK